MAAKVPHFREGAATNWSEKLGGMLKAPEHAHVFFDARSARIATLEAERATVNNRLSAQEIRLVRLERTLAVNVVEKDSTSRSD